MHRIGRLHHRLQGEVVVPAINAPLFGIDDHGHTVVPDHAARVIGSELPHGQLSSFSVHPEHGAHHVAGAIGLNPRQQRMQGPVCVPQTEHRVVVAFAFLQLMDVQICAAVASVFIVREVGHRGGMVQGRVKGGSVVWTAAVDLDAAKLLVPKGFTSRSVGIEVETLNLGFQVADGTFDVAKTQRHMHIEFVKYTKIGHENGHHGHFLNQRSVVQGVEFSDFSKLVSPFKVSVKGHGEVDVLFFSPVFAHPVADEHPCSSGLDAVVDEVVPVVEVHNPSQRVGLIERVPVDAHPWG